MKCLLVGYSLFVVCFVGVVSQRVADFEPSGRRGDVLSLGDVSDQTVFNVDNTGTKGGGSGTKGGGPLDCAKIIRECQCFGGGSVTQAPGPQRPISPTGQYQMDYDTYG